MLRLFKNGLPLLRLGESACACFSTQNFRKVNSGRLKNSTVSLCNFGKTSRWFCTNVTNPEEDPIYKPNFEAIAAGDPEVENKLRLIRLELEIAKHEGDCVPSNEFLTDHYWKELLDFPTRSQRRKFLNFLFKVEKKQEKRQTKKDQKKMEREEQPEEERPEFTLDYKLGRNQFMLRIYETTMNNFYNHRLMQAMMFGQKLVVDCGYYDDMTTRENQNCAKQLMLLFAENRINDVPFDLHFCNANPESTLMRRLYSYIRTMYEPEFPLNLHKESYLDHFPKEKLVYLTPHCREVLTEYNHDDIYIIGAIVDKVNTEPISLAKAKREGLRMAKLPLDHHLKWGSGSGKSLTINQVTSILLDIKNTSDWNHSLRHVPRRKLAEFKNSDEPKYEYETKFNKNQPRGSSWRSNKEEFPRRQFTEFKTFDEPKYEYETKFNRNQPNVSSWRPNKEKFRNKYDEKHGNQRRLSNLEKIFADE